MAFTDELARYGDRVTDLAAGRAAGCWTSARLLADPRPKTRSCTAAAPNRCWPPSSEQCTGWPPDALHFERFTPKAERTAPTNAFEVELARVGQDGCGARRTVDPATRSRPSGLVVLSSCQEGTCGTCETDVLEGRPTTATRCSPRRNGTGTS